MQPKNLSAEETQKLAAVRAQLAESFAKKELETELAQLQRLVVELRAAGIHKTDASKDDGFSISRAIRGLSARQGLVVNPASATEDINYASKALDPGTTPGSYLVPEIQADEIIELLGKGGALRGAGPTVWPMARIEKLRIPQELAEPTVEYLAPNAPQTATDPNFQPINLDLKTRRALTAVPNELLSVSVPGIDMILTRMLARAMAKHEDLSFFTGGLSGGPTGINQASGTTNVAQAGASLAYSDLLEVLAKSADVEAEGPFVWWINAGDFFRLILNLKDTQNRPIVQPLASESGIRFTLFGEPVFLTPRIPTNLGAGTNETYIIRTNPSYIHLGDSGTVEIAVSGERFFENNQTAIRAVNRHDFGYSPAAGIVKLTAVK